MEGFYPYHFDGEIGWRDFGSLRYMAIFLPQELGSTLPFRGRQPLRVEGEIDDYPFRGTWQPVAGGDWYLKLSKSLVKQGEYVAGDRVSMRFRIDDPDGVDMPEELRCALEASAAATRGWRRLTPGKRRGLAYRISSAKTASTRAKRAADIVEALRTGDSPAKGN